MMIFARDRFLFPAVISLISVFATAQLAFGLEIYVSPTGADSAPGTPEQPLASPAGARDRVRALRKDDPSRANEAATIHFAPGVYPIRETLQLGAEDSRTEWIGDEKSGVVWSGGRELPPFTEADGGLWQTKALDSEGKPLRFAQLWVNGVRATRARTPNRGKGYFYTQSTARKALPGLEFDGDITGRSFLASPGDLSALQALDAEELREAETVVYHAWQTARHRVAGVNFQSGQIQFTGSSRWNFMQWEPRQRFHLENVRSALDEPGEWFAAMDGTVYYKPMTGESLDSSRAVVPVLSQLVKAAGDAQNRAFLDDLSIRNIRFEHTGYVTPAEGYSDGQANPALRAAVEISGARGAKLEHIEVRATGAHGIAFTAGVTDSVVENVLLEDLGGGGVYLGEREMRSDPFLRTERNRVENCAILQGGRVHAGSVGVWLGQTAENVISHNEIADFFYTGISVGWVWGYQESFSVRNRIENNHIHHLGFGVLSDMGGIYTLGPASGTILRGNHIHDITSYSYGGWAIYPDEGSSGLLIENNLCHHTSHAGFHQHYGKDNMVRNNIFAFGGNAQIQRTRVEDHHSFTFAGNIVLAKDAPLFFGSWEKPGYRLERNVYWQLGATPFDFNGRAFEQWQAEGFDARSVVADPLFVNAEEGDWSLRADSPALALGFRPFDWKKAGLKAGSRWAERSLALVYPAVEHRVIPAFRLKESFEQSAPGDRPVGVKGFQEIPASSAALRVESDPDGSGNLCLLVRDAPGLPNAFDPHFAYQTDYRDAPELEERENTRMSFRFKTGAKAKFLHEWRDYDVPGQSAAYVTGPMLRFEDGALHVPGHESVAVPENQWVGCEIVWKCREGEAGKWTLRLRLPEGERMFEGLPPANPVFRSLGWAGFISNGAEDSAFWLDDVEIAPLGETQ